MKLGNLKLYTILSFLFLKTFNLYAEEKINLNVLEPTFEEEAEIVETLVNEASNVKSKKKQLSSNNESIVKLKALDKITAKTKDINIVIGKKKRFGYLEIFPRKCNKFEDQNSKGVAAYIQVRDLTNKNNDEVFVFNGWMFSSSPSITPFDHSVYDIWLVRCY